MVVRHDWPTIIAEIKAAYEKRYGLRMTDYKLAQIITNKCARRIYERTVARLEDGYTKMPKSDVEAALLSLYVADCGQKTIVQRETLMRGA